VPGAEPDYPLGSEPGDGHSRRKLFGRGERRSGLGPSRFKVFSELNRLRASRHVDLLDGLPPVHPLCMPGVLARELFSEGGRLDCRNLRGPRPRRTEGGLSPVRRARLAGSPLLLRRRVLPLQDAGPVKLEIRIVGFYETDGVFVECRSANADARRRSEPIEDARTRLPASSSGVDHVGVFVAVLVAAEPEVRQGYFLFVALFVFIALCL